MYPNYRSIVTASRHPCPPRRRPLPEKLIPGNLRGEMRKQTLSYFIIMSDKIIIIIMIMIIIIMMITVIIVKLIIIIKKRSYFIIIIIIQSFG